MNHEPGWLTLVTTLPTRNAAERMRLWRALKVLGAATLRDGVYLLPARPDTGDALHALAEGVRAAGGGAEVLRVAADREQGESFRQLFDRSSDYGALIAATNSANADTKSLRRLTRQLTELAAIDYFPAAALEQARQALADLNARVDPGEPGDARGEIGHLATADFAGRTWATRKAVWVDRMASSWLIRRFIDRKARFLWLERPQDCPADAVGFDFDGATFTHTEGRVTYEVLAASFGLDRDPAIARVGAIVHCLDVGGAAVAEAPGIEAVLAGLRARTPSDAKLVIEAGRVFDSLYTSYQPDDTDA